MLKTEEAIRHQPIDQIQADSHQKFFSWLGEKGATFPHLEVFESADSGSGLFLRFTNNETSVSIPLHAPAALATIPRELLVNANSICGLNIPNVFKACSRIPEGKISDERIRIILYLILIFKSVAKNEHHIYASFLPKKNELSSLTFWSSAEKQLLLGTPLDSALSSKISSMEKDYEQIIKPFFEELGSISVSLEDFLYADALYWSRVLSFKELSLQSQIPRLFSDSPFKLIEAPELHMIPLIDFCNHAEKPNVRWELTPDHVELVSYSGVDLSFEGPHNVSELCISYGTKSNAEMLFTYGFCLNEVDERGTFNFHAPLDMMDENAEQTAIRIHLARKLALQPFVDVKHFTEKGSVEKTLDSILGPKSTAMLFLCVMEIEYIQKLVEKYQDSAVQVEDFLGDVRSICSVPLLQLRSVMVLKDALTEHCSLLEMTFPTDELLRRCRHHIALSATIYRKSLMALVRSILEKLEDCEKSLSQHPELLQYFE